MTSTVCLTFDFDALSVWLAYDEPTAAILWRGEYGARVGVLERGREARLWELPMSFELDDWPHFQFNFSVPARSRAAERGT